MSTGHGRVRFVRGSHPDAAPRKAYSRPLYELSPTSKKTKTKSAPKKGKKTTEVSEPKVEFPKHSDPQVQAVLKKLAMAEAKRTARLRKFKSVPRK